MLSIWADLEKVLQVVSWSGNGRQEGPKTGLDQLMLEVLQTGLTSFGLSKGSVALVLRMPIVQSINASQVEKRMLGLS